MRPGALLQLELMDLLQVAFEPALGVKARAAAAALVALILPQILVTQHVVYQRIQ